MKPAIARIRSRPCLSCRYSKYGIFSDGRLLTPPAWPTRENVSSPLVVGRSLITICSSTMYASRPTAPTSATIPARERCRASQASCLSLSCVTATPNTLRPRRRRETHPARRLGPDLVAPDQARGAVAGVEHHVQGGRGEADQGLDPSHARELLRTAVGHAGAIVDSPFVLVREVMTESVDHRLASGLRARDRRPHARAQRRLGRAGRRRAPRGLHPRPRPRALGRRRRPLGRRARERPRVLAGHHRRAGHGGRGGGPADDAPRCAADRRAERRRAGGRGDARRSRDPRARARALRPRDARRAAGLLLSPARRLSPTYG